MSPRQLPLVDRARSLSIVSTFVRSTGLRGLAKGYLVSLLKWMDVYRVSLAAILLVGFFLRVWQLGSAPFWVDEAFTVWAAENFVRGQGFSDVVGPESPYRRAWLTTTLPISALFALFGSSEFVARMPSAVLGTATIVVVYLIGSQYHRHVGIVAAILVALDPFMIVWAREARMYAHLQLFYVLAIYLLSRWHVQHDLQLRSRYAVGLVVIVGLGSLTHRAFLAFGAVFLAFMCLLVISHDPRKKFRSSSIDEVAVRALAYGFCGVLVAVGFVAVNGVPGVLSAPAPGQWPERGYDYYWVFFVDNYSILWVLAVAGMVYLLLGDDRDHLLVYAVIIPFIVASLTATKAPRYVYHLVPLLFLIAIIPLAHLVDNLFAQSSQSINWGRRFDARRTGITIVLIFVLAVTPPAAALEATQVGDDNPFHPGHSDFEEASAFIAAHDDGTGIVMSTRPEVSLWYLNETDYFFRQHGVKYAEQRGENLVHTRTGTVVVTDPSVVREAMDEQRPIWLLAGQRFNQGFTSNEMRSYVRQNFVEISNESWHNMAIYYWSPYIDTRTFSVVEDMGETTDNAFVYEDGDNQVLALGRTVDTPAHFGEQGEQATGSATMEVAIRADEPILIESRTFGNDDGQRFVNVSVSTDGEEWQLIHRNADDQWAVKQSELPADFTDDDRLYIRVHGGTEGGSSHGGLVDYVRVATTEEWEREYLEVEDPHR